jgi:hypothetical protein
MIDMLREALAAHNLIIVVGSGVTINSTLNGVGGRVRAIYDEPEVD